MYTKETTVKCLVGLQARPATMLVKLSDQFKSKIEISDGKRTVSVKGLILVLSLAVKKGSRITVIADGEDEMDAVHAVIGLLEREDI